MANVLEVVLSHIKARFDNLHPSNLAKNDGGIFRSRACTYTFQSQTEKTICVNVIKCYQITVLSDSLARLAEAVENSYFLTGERRLAEIKQAFDILDFIMIGNCPFCTIESHNMLAENELAVAFRDAFPVTHLHTLVIPRRHVSSVFDLHEVEVQACWKMLQKAKSEILQIDSSVDGFNVGINIGEVAGQTIHHSHFHLIPRRKLDVQNPVGGVRNIIPGKGDYL